MDLVLGSADDFLRLLAAELLHGGVVVLLRLGEEHLQDAALVLLLQHVEVVDDHSEGERAGGRVQSMALGGLQFRGRQVLQKNKWKTKWVIDLNVIGIILIHLSSRVKA